MSDSKKNSHNDMCEQERLLSGKSEAFLSMLTKRGLLEDQKISDEKVRQAAKAKKRGMYHNTQLMLHHYRDINWALECFPTHIAEELDSPMGDLDVLLSLIDAEIGMNNEKLENRLMSVQKSRLLLDRFNEALTVLRQKPGNGEMMYQSLYLTYIAPETLSHAEILYRLNISSRHYYRTRQQAINILSIRLWAAPAGELDAWLEVLTLLEAL
ncbi:MAG: hypothetical protein LBK56_08575 [Gracilibacteraceae bacterium]|jgi:hypothetical protein|nr:hypothetical protein [Gracilibacteraceae bacterium]